MQIKITPDTVGTTTGKVADVELHFTDGPLAGLKLVGFSIWQRRTGKGYNVTHPARQYSINGERRSFALLRPIADSAATDRLRELILSAYEQYLADATRGTTDTNSTTAGRLQF
jgi:hypothetical protein